MVRGEPISLRQLREALTHVLRPEDKDRVSRVYVGDSAKKTPVEFERTFTFDGTLALKDQEIRTAEQSGGLGVWLSNTLPNCEPWGVKITGQEKQSGGTHAQIVATFRRTL